MRKTLVSTARLLPAAALAAALLLLPPPARGVAKEIVQLQRDVALLQQQVRDLQTSVDKNNAVLKTLVEQSLDAVNRMETTVGDLEKSVREAQGTTNTRVDALATQVQSLRDAVDEMSARLGRMAQQLSETQSVLQSVDARLAPPAPPTPEGTGTAPGATPAPQPPPSAKALYDNALRDFTSGKYDLAWQQFSDFFCTTRAASWRATPSSIWAKSATGRTTTAGPSRNTTRCWRATPPASRWRRRSSRKATPCWS